MTAAVLDAHPIRIEPSQDYDAARDLVVRTWGDDALIIYGRPHRAADMQLLNAVGSSGETLGTAFYKVNNTMVLLGAIVVTGPAKSGTATRLFDAVVSLTREAGMKKIRACTSNDNFAAMQFYQKRGMRFLSLYPGAVDAFRTMRPGLVTVGPNGVPVRDMIELDLDL
jgi:N-acetylglutamate synthase-like GNAT family acetyltransferase